MSSEGSVHGGWLQGLGPGPGPDSPHPRQGNQEAEKQGQDRGPPSRGTDSPGPPSAIYERIHGRPWASTRPVIQSPS